MARARTRDWRQHYNEALEAIKSRSMTAALESFDRAVASEPDHWEPYYGRAWAILNDERRRGDPERLATAAQDLDRALDLGGGSDAAALSGHVASLRGEHERAVTLLLQAVGHSPQRDLVADGLIDSLSKLLHELENSKDLEDAVATCDRLQARLEATSLHGPLRHELLAEVVATRAFCHQRAGEPNRAEADLRQVARLMPNHPRLPEGLQPVPAAARTAATSDPTFESFGGLDVEKTFAHNLAETFELYFSDPDVEAVRKRLGEYGQSPTRSILLFGPSGCGKTYIIRAFSGEYRRRHGRDLPIHRLRLNEVLNRWVGEDEKAITRIFDQAVETQPSILFGDEIDSIGMSREHGAGQEWRVQLTSHFLQEIDRLREQDPAVLLFGCTNRVWAVDLALMRRFDDFVVVELPNEEVRAKIFQVHLARLHARVRPRDIDLHELAERSHGLTPGDIEKVVRRSVSDVLAKRAGDSEGRPLGEADLLRAVEEYRQPMHVRDWVRKSVTALREAGHDEEADRVEETYGPYLRDAGPASGPPPDPATWRPIPEEAWTEEPEFDLTLMERMR